MSKDSRGDVVREERQLWDSAIAIRPLEKKHYGAKVFRSGNSLALRLPAGLKLAPGMEMDLTVEDDMVFSFQPIDRPRARFNIAKVAGSATTLDFIRDEDRLFEDRPPLWHDPLAGGDRDA